MSLYCLLIPINWARRETWALWWLNVARGQRREEETEERRVWPSQGWQRDNSTREEEGKRDINKINTHYCLWTIKIINICCWCINNVGLGGPLIAERGCFLSFPPPPLSLTHSPPSWCNVRHVFGRMTTPEASFSLCSGTWGRVMKTIVALSSLVMITPFPQHWSLGRNVFKTEPFSSARLSSHFVCVRVCIVCVCL